MYRQRKLSLSQYYQPIVFTDITDYRFSDYRSNSESCEVK